MEIWEVWDENWKVLQEADQEAKKHGRIVGRYITHPYADGKAVYKIVKETRSSATIEVVTGLGDDWVLPAWGEKATLPKNVVIEFLGRRDGWEKIFNK